VDEANIKYLIYVTDFVYGSIDGIITTFAVVSGVEGASLAPTIILILGFANLFADGLSMAVGKYLSARSEQELYHKEKKREQHEVRTIPEEEVGEVTAIYKKKGFKGKLLKDVVKQITSKKSVWVDTMMKEELGLIIDKVKPKESAVVTFFSFIFMGLIPLFAFILGEFLPNFQTYAFFFSIIITGVALYTVGTIKGKIVKKNTFISGLQTMFIGGLAAVTAYFVGFFLKTLF
jgi:VIT1/CCC1 family predicted Fe2+/Mn2+ transporter